MTIPPLLHPLFSDNAVLQRDSPLTIWGWTTPGQVVTVQFDGVAQTVNADDNGRWEAGVAAHAAGGPYALEVASNGQTQTRQNLLFGDLWLCSGQSNMEWTIDNSNEAEAEIAAADFPDIRLLHVPRMTQKAPAETFEGDWQVCGPQTVGNFSAVGYFFGRKLQNELNIPIGLIGSSWGGTPAESWTSASALQTMDDFKELAPVADHNSPTALYNGMIAPLLPAQIKGAIWYQGESNAGRAAQYRTLLPTLIGDWRARFGEPLPFYIVQLANYLAPDETPCDDAWPHLREAQALTAAKMPDSGLAVAIDIGEADDIHPRNKQDVGLRLALLALKQTYGFDVEASGPVLRDFQTEGDALILTFDFARNLSLKGDSDRVFAIAGADGVYHWATPTIGGDTIILRSPAVEAPANARFGWSNNPRANLYNDAGLPAAPFRTDG